MIGAGYWGLTRARSAEDYLVAGRRLGPFMYVGTLSAVVLGGSFKGPTPRHIDGYTGKD
jgi:SSS family solute:Na+ symporter